MTRLVGADLAWRLEKNNSALALMDASHGVLTLCEVIPTIIGSFDVLAKIDEWQPAGLAIDAPLVVKNQTGMRKCERELNRVYRAKYAGCHPSNLNLYPRQEIGHFSYLLRQQGFEHLAEERWQIECYPHPTLIEWFQLERRLAYKRGTVDHRRAGQIALVELLNEWVSGGKFVVAKSVEYLFESKRIECLKGKSLKINEDALDAIICGLVAGCYHFRRMHYCFGNVDDGYIWVPKESL
ncbi:DUF429 domain-containing protein [Umboniibacter marinipuniceus]|uniref:Putative RNase H-like nuclease n=1 Tax=Umboniibacter marinipuniceus TaxID=569599 RepID=A0A3M0A8Q6_9GAMM|nr:DUF429 domain-containing protein [Umboniibacter marinipuniceus]RMA80996.1 putative RNase H-like nuclease [Umboniibacter marinipuniceus]